MFSNSWGAFGEGANEYTSDSRGVDQFMYLYPDAIVIFAAGNSGLEGFGSVVSPSTGKNCISVGAGLNAAESFTSIYDSFFSAEPSNDILPSYYGPLASVDVGSSQLNPRFTPDLTQLNPRFTPDLTQLNPQFTPDLTQLNPRFTPDLTQLNPNRESRPGPLGVLPKMAD